MTRPLDFEAVDEISFAEEAQAIADDTRKLASHMPDQGSMQATYRIAERVQQLAQNMRGFEE